MLVHVCAPCKQNFVHLIVILYYLLVPELGMGLILCKKAPQQNGTSVSEATLSSEDDIDEDRGSGRKSSDGEEVVRAIYAFNGTNEDEVHYVLSLFKAVYNVILTNKCAL